MQVHKCRGAEGETLMGKVLYRGKGFTHIVLRDLSWKNVVSKRKMKELNHLTWSSRNHDQLTFKSNQHCV